jgi:Metallo-beta-lactamase superfamily
MKKLHRPELYGYSHFDEARNIDFHSVVWVRPEGNVVIDPLVQSAHDKKHLEELGGAALVVVTNSDHVRDARALAERTGARLAGPRAEQAKFPISCQLWLGEGDEPVPGLQVLEMHGSKTPGELALLIEGYTLVTGDLVRAHRGGALDLLPESKLTDRALALDSVRRLLDLGKLEAVLPGDGWPVFRYGHRVLRELVASLDG